MIYIYNTMSKALNTRIDSILLENCDFVHIVLHY